jgi:hypothetical protein
MKKVSEIMQELGFRPEGSDAVKKAFVKNLIREAQRAEFSRPKDEAKENKPGDDSKHDVDNYQQISLFDKKISG